MVLLLVLCIVVSVLKLVRLRKVRRVAFTLVVARLLPERKFGCLRAARLIVRMRSAMSIPVGTLVSVVVGHC